MELLIGLTLALAVSISATMARMDRDRSFYPVVVVVVASYYDLFAVMGGSAQALSLETVAMMAFIAMALIGFKTNLWLVVAALVGHGVFDCLHSWLIDNPGVPIWWPKFCCSYDIAAGAYLAWRLKRSQSVNGKLPAYAGVLRISHIAPGSRTLGPSA